MDEALLSLKNLTSNSDYNFIHKLVSSQDVDDDFSPDSPYENSNFITSYCDPLNYKQDSKSLSFMTFNIQSISSKFTEFLELICILDKSNSSPDVICLQELWSFPDFKYFNLPNYHPLCFKLRKNAQGGGVGLFIKNNLKFSILQQASVFSERIFETFFVEISLPNKTKYTVGSLYRPGTVHPTLSNTQLYNEFSELFANLCDSLCNFPNVILLGDLNLDVLQYGQTNRPSEYIDLLFSYGFLQLVTQPTRCNDNSATLIDHVCTNIKLPEYKIDILTSKISDHFPVVFYIPLKK